MHDHIDSGSSSTGLMSVELCSIRLLYPGVLANYIYVIYTGKLANLNLYLGVSAEMRSEGHVFNSKELQSVEGNGISIL